MFYEELIDLLRADSRIAATVSTFVKQSGTIPAIFSDSAPEGAKFPYITVKIGKTKQPANVIDLATINIDYWDYDQSRVKADESAIAVEDLLDMKCMNSENFNDIRFSIGTADYVNQTDSRAIHFNSPFTARSSRSGWMKRNLQ